ncbi:MAG: hypothetical protein J0L93_00640 [Deltaproteobacteria bacterium]|nr:hypothetical protein [Deltaproteobacteria bacterium]
MVKRVAILFLLLRSVSAEAIGLCETTLQYVTAEGGVEISNKIFENEKRIRDLSQAIKTNLVQLKKLRAPFKELSEQRGFFDWFLWGALSINRVLVKERSALLRQRRKLHQDTQNLINQKLAEFKAMDMKISEVLAKKDSQIRDLLNLHNQLEKFDNQIESKLNELEEFFDEVETTSVMLVGKVHVHQTHHHEVEAINSYRRLRNYWKQLLSLSQQIAEVNPSSRDQGRLNAIREAMDELEEQREDAELISESDLTDSLEQAKEMSYEISSERYYLYQELKDAAREALTIIP